MDMTMSRLTTLSEEELATLATSTAAAIAAGSGGKKEEVADSAEPAVDEAAMDVEGAAGDNAPSAEWKAEQNTTTANASVPSTPTKPQSHRQQTQRYRRGTIALSPMKCWQRPSTAVKRSFSRIWSQIAAPPYYQGRNTRADPSLALPIRQTASIFKQPVTVIKNRDSCVKHDLKFGPQEKPKQLFWEKRLENLRACDINGEELGIGELPAALQPAGPNVTNQTLLQSIAAALHVFSHPIVGQNAPLTALQMNSAAFLNPEQPLTHPIVINDEDIAKQEDKVDEVRKKLQDIIKKIE